MSISYLAQVRRLRALAKKTVSAYGITLKQLQFIQHGENATFKVTAVNGRKYLVRIHRGGYHTQKAIIEELHWLKQLSKNKSLQAPVPIRSKSNRLLERISTEQIPNGRDCCVFKWIDGKHVGKSLRLEHMFELGLLLAELHRSQPSQLDSHRRYWSAEGLVGKNATFGSVDKIQDIDLKTRKILIRARVRSLVFLKKYESKYPNRFGLIHGDPHFGNLLLSERGLAPIDFDDCGLGFFAYDLAVVINSMQHRLEAKRKKEIPAFRKALIDGYSNRRSWDAVDDQILQHLLIARQLMGVSWLHSRSDNPRLKKHVKPAARHARQQVKVIYKF